jgi:glycogen(starch) synthase
MKDNGYENTLIAFIFVPAAHRGENIEVLKNVSLFEELYDHVDEFLPEIREQIITSLTNGKLSEEVFTEEFKQQSKKMIAHFKEKEGRSPPLCAFVLNNEGGDAIIQSLNRNGLLNREEDRVKVIFYPAYLSSADRLIGLEYNEATITSDMGVFPSFYEPWGYTPLESAAQATPAITTDLAGYGQFIEGKGDGIRVLNVEGRKYEEIVEDLFKELLQLATIEKPELTKRRMNAKELSMLADWSILSENYVKAHDLALKKKS